MEDVDRGEEDQPRVDQIRIIELVGILEDQSNTSYTRHCVDNVLAQLDQSGEVAEGRAQRAARIGIAAPREGDDGDHLREGE
eukprot:12081696-Prorocentrum_lima.AAC.1